ncbi:MAG: hypothetical protein B6D64_13720 [Bacteroidetes bacterium 4484_276]|nr:MAG: hypothetical protein B6D64_13720 [Bacteroidetes bacterium 4484_276]
MDWYSMTTKGIEIEIGQRIKERRIKKNMTQLELAKKTGLSRVSISKIESGNGVGFSSLIEILRMLDLLQNLEQLFPPPELSPLEILKIQGKKRKRASSPKNR